MAVALPAMLALLSASSSSASAALLLEPFPGPPIVTLEQPASPSNDTAPSFSGTSSDTPPVTVSVYSGTSAEGTPVAVLRARPSGGYWTSADVSPELGDGTYSAVATQPSSLGNQTGVSNVVTFEVDTRPPRVTLEAPPSPSNDITPSFSGTTNEDTTVTVEVFEGTKPEGAIVATATAQGTPKSWTSGPLTPGLPAGKRMFTAIATQASALKNAAGRSAPVTFVVDTEPPVITLKAPPSPSNDRTPSFSGTASEGTTVRVEVFEGTSANGALVATATATGAPGSWTSSVASPALRDGTFTAVATQTSAIGNPTGRSTPVNFTVDTAAPTVTLNALRSPSSDRFPSFSGTASDDTPVSVHVYKGTQAEGAVVASATAEVSRGEWVSPKATRPLEWGTYTAVATQPSSIGNPSGTSVPVTFAVEQIPPTVATEPPSLVARTSAALYASVDPEGGPVNDCFFEYGTTTAYGATIECGFLSGIAAFPPSGASPVAVFARIFGLRPSTTYHFRVVAIGEGGTAVGADDTFTTLPPFSFGEEGATHVVRTASATPRAASPRPLSARKLASLIAQQLARLWHAADTTTMLKTGTFKTTFRAPEAGYAEFAWRYLPPSNKRAGKTTQASLLVAFGRTSSHNAGAQALTVRLTNAGGRLLKGSPRSRLLATCRFTPLHAPAVRMSAAFALSR